MPLQFASPFTDPFSEVQKRIESILRADVNLTVEPGNIVEDGDPKTITAPADYVEWRVVASTGGGVSPWKTSTSTHMVQVYQIALVTNDEDPTIEAFPLKFAVLKALLRAGDKLGLPYVLGWTLPDVREDLGNAGLDRGVEGWAVVATIAVQMQFKTADLTGA